MLILCFMYSLRLAIINVSLDFFVFIIFIVPFLGPQGIFSFALMILSSGID